MWKPEQFALLLALVCLAACEKPPGVATGDKVQPKSSDTFAKEYEEWKTRAVKEFPELGVAGSPMNTRFLQAAKELADRNGEELKYPNWPYLLAVRLQKGPASEAKQSLASPPVPARTPVAPVTGNTYTIEQIKALGSVPGSVTITGRVTKIDEFGLPPGVLMVVLDNALKCELTFSEGNAINGLSWLRSGSTLSLVRQSNRGPSSPVVSLTIGDSIWVRGGFSKKNGAPFFVGELAR